MQKVTNLRIRSGLDDWTARNAKSELGVFHFDPVPRKKRRSDPEAFLLVAILAALAALAAVLL